MFAESRKCTDSSEMRTDDRWIAVIKIPFPFVPLSFLSCCDLVESIESEMRLPEVGQTGPELPVWLFQCERHYYWQQVSKYALYRRVHTPGHVI